MGSCALPSALTASAAPCSGPTTNITPFDPPPGWDGSCTANEHISPNKLCGGVPCVRSLTTAPLTMTESGCAPSQQIVPHKTPPAWSTFARGCEDASGGTWGTCAEHGETCAPAAPAGFRQCVSHEGDRDCPSFTPYIEKHLFYGGADDSRDCSPCSCGAPTGSSCAASLSIYSDSACSTPLFSSLSIDSNAPACVDLPVGSALGSKSIGTPTYTPGQCQASGGAPTGSISPVQPSTFCCLP
jgi:hypothetical protein